MNDLPDNNADEAKRWMSLVDEDLAVARLLSKDEGGPVRAVSFYACAYAHLAVENALKASLIASGIPFRKMHDLVEIRALLPGEKIDTLDSEDLRVLNPWLIDGRHPGGRDATVADAHQCVGAAERVVSAARAAFSEAEP